MSLLDYNAFGGMDGTSRQRTLRDWKMSSYAKNTRLWDGSIRAYKSPRKVSDCTTGVLSKMPGEFSCVEPCSAFARSPCGAKCLYTLVNGKIAENGRIVGLDRPKEAPSASLVTDPGDDAVIFRVLCVNDSGEYSAPSVPTEMISAKYGSVIKLNWSGCTPYRVEALLTQSLVNKSEIGKDVSQWVTVGEFSTRSSTIVFKPDQWDLTADGYDPTAYCDPPSLDCFTVTEDGFFVGYKGTVIYTSERHEPSKFPRAAIKNLHSKIKEIVTAAQVVYISSDDGIYVMKVAPDKDGSSIGIYRSYENVVPTKGTLSLANSGAAFASRYGVYVFDERTPPVNVVSKLVSQDVFEKDWLPISGIVQRGVFYGTKEDGESYHIDFPSSSGDASEFGKLVLLDCMGSRYFAGRDGGLYYSVKDGTFEFDGGDSYLAAKWVSNTFTAPSRVSFSRAKVLGENLDGVKVSIYADDKIVFSFNPEDQKVRTLPFCVSGFRFKIEVEIPASSQEIVVNRIQLASSYSELSRV